MSNIYDFIKNSPIWSFLALLVICDTIVSIVKLIITAINSKP